MTHISKDAADIRRRKDLAAFLKAKRAVLNPRDFGLLSLGRRRAQDCAERNLLKSPESGFHGTPP